MHDDRRKEGVHGSGIANSESQQDDALGALIGAAGRRATPPDEAYRHVFTAAHDAWQAKVRSRRARTWQLAVAASVAIIGIATAMIVQLVPRDMTLVASVQVVQGDVAMRAPGSGTFEPLRSLQAPIAIGAEIRTASDGRLALRLAGNGSLRIDADSSVTIAGMTDFRLAAGTLYIDSGDEMPERAFAIGTSLGTVRDIGTQFEVTTEPQSIRVRVRDGAVSISGSGAQADIFGSAGEQLRVTAGGNVTRNAFSPYDPDWVWVESLAGAPQVEGQTLIAFLDWVANETGRELRFDTPLTETRARGVILHGDAATLSPLEALDVVLSTTDFTYSLRDDGAIEVSLRTQ
jgi:hypothetical protein